MSAELGGRAITAVAVSHAVDVDVRTGAASIRIEVPCTPGRMGFGPALVLTYSGTGAGSPFGLGWSLSGWPAIGIDVRRRAPRYDDSDDLGRGRRCGVFGAHGFFRGDGSMSWWRRYLEKRNDEERHRRLVRAEHFASLGKVIDVRSVVADADVIQLGVEYWVVTPGYVLLPRTSDVDGGLLILEEGLPLADKSKLRFLRKRVQRVLFTIK